MKYGSYITGGISRAVNAARTVRWRDPLVQSWGLIGGLLVAGITVHYVAGRDAGEQKNESEWAAAFLPAAPASEWRPAVVMNAGTPAGTASRPGTENLDLRAIADAAAARDGWRHLSPALRAHMADMPAAAAQISVGWSHTRGGDARAFSLYHKDTLGGGDGLPYDFVIGNGKRSGDGLVEALAGTGKQTGDYRICLAGHPGDLTPAQKAALGELIISLEARCGTLHLVTQASSPAEEIAAATLP